MREKLRTCRELASPVPIFGYFRGTSKSLLTFNIIFHKIDAKMLIKRGFYVCDI